jgi:hypothetical protein
MVGAISFHIRVVGDRGIAEKDGLKHIQIGNR